jgi:hypothetical protein
MAVAITLKQMGGYSCLAMGFQFKLQLGQGFFNSCYSTQTGDYIALATANGFGNGGRLLTTALFNEGGRLCQFLIRCAPRGNLAGSGLFKICKA